MSNPVIGIIDDTDVPIAENLVVIRPNKIGGFRWDYLSAGRRTKSLGGDLDHIPHLFTDASRLGVSLVLKGDMLRATQIGVSVAVYPNGEPRNWWGFGTMPVVQVRRHLVRTVRRALEAE